VPQLFYTVVLFILSLGFSLSGILALVQLVVGRFSVQSCGVLDHPFLFLSTAVLATREHVISIHSLAMDAEGESIEE
jgi:hypothetical protein